MIDLEDLDYEPDDIENQVADIQECSYQVPEPSGQDFQDTDYNSSGEPSLSSGLELERPSLQIQSFRDKMNYRNMHINGDKDSCRNQFGQYTNSSQSFFLDSSDEESDHGYSEDDHYKQDDNYLENADYLESGNTQESQFYHSEGNASDSNSCEYIGTFQDVTTSPRTSPAAKNDANRGTPNLSRVSNESRQKISKTTSEPVTKENPSKNILSTSNTKRKSFNFTIQVKGDQRCCLNLPIMQKKRKPWLTSAKQAPTNIVSLTSKDETLPFSLGAKSTSSKESDNQGPVAKGLSDFKIPLKRPPTRQKLPAKRLSGSIDQTGTMAVKDVDDNCDIISLIASTNIEDDQDDIDPPVDKRANEVQISSVETNAYQISSKQIPNGIEMPNTNRVSEWVQQSSKPVAKIPVIYRGLCYNFFFRNNCWNKNCHNSHILLCYATKISQMSKLQDADLKEAYDFAKEKPLFFAKIYKVFADVFGSKGIRLSQQSRFPTNNVRRFDTHLSVSSLFKLKIILTKVYSGYWLQYNKITARFFNPLATATMPKSTLLRNKRVENDGEHLELPFYVVTSVSDVYKLAINKSEGDNKAELINMVHLIFDESYNINKVEGLTIILENLQKTDLITFEYTVQYVLMEVGLRAYPSLGGVLLETIVCTTGGRSCWAVLRNLFIAGNRLVGNRLAIRFLVNILREPIDYKICQDVHKQILKYKCLDLSLVPYDIREAFLKASSFDIRNEDNVPSVERDLNKERKNYDRSNSETLNAMKPNSASNKIGRIDYPLVPSRFPACGGVERNFFRTTEESVTRPVHSPRFSPPREFGMNLGNPQDFASLSQQQSTFAPPNVHIQNEVNNTKLDFTVPPPTAATSIQRFNSPNSSEDEVTLQSISSDSDSNRGQNTYFPENCSADISGSGGMTYFRDGLQYDPTKDYMPPNKKRRTESDHLTGLIPGRGRLPRANKSTERDKQQMIPLSRSVEQQSSQAHPEYMRPTEPLVSSSSDPMRRSDKPPEHPIFGKIYFDPNYEFNISLHNQYLEKIDNVDINEDDVHKLNHCIKRGDGKKFLALAHKYVGPITVQNFISMTLAHLKGMNQMVARTYKKLLASIETHRPFFFGELKIRVLLEVITMNILFELEKRNQFDDAKDLLLKFSNWDSLVTSRLFITDTNVGFSIVGRYLFIARMMAFSKPELTYEILACPNLHLLENYHNWPYYPQCSDPDILNADLEARNAAILNFLRGGFLLNTAAVTQLYKLALKRNAGIWSFDVKPFIDPMIVTLINKTQVVSLKQIHSEISLFYNFMEKDTLRAYLATMSKHLTTSDVFQLFEKCMARNVYQMLVKGQCLVDTVEIRTNLLPEEIELIISYYFSKMLELGNVPQFLQFVIQLPADRKHKALQMLNTNKSIKIIQKTIKHILKYRCNVNCKTYIADIVEVDKGELLNFVRNGNGS